VGDYQQILFTVLDGLIRLLVPILGGFLLNYLVKRMGRDRFLFAKTVFTSIVSTLEQQYRCGEIPKDDRFALAMELGIKKTGLSEEQCALLIREAVFAMNVQIGKYAYSNTVSSSEVPDNVEGNSRFILPG